MVRITRLYSEPIAKAYALLRQIILPIRKVEKHIPQTGLIFDVGCGFGVTSLYFALSSKDRQVVGFDLSRKRIISAKKAGKSIENLKFFIKDISKEHIKKKADCIAVIDLLHHIKYSDQKRFLQQCYANVKKGGRLVVKEIDKKLFFRCLWTLILDKIITLGGKMNYSNRTDLIRILENIGFKVRYYNIASMFYPHFILVCEK